MDFNLSVIFPWGYNCQYRSTSKITASVYVESWLYSGVGFTIKKKIVISSQIRQSGLFTRQTKVEDTVRSCPRFNAGQSAIHQMRNRNGIAI